MAEQIFGSGEQDSVGQIEPDPAVLRSERGMRSSSHGGRGATDARRSSATALAGRCCDDLKDAAALGEFAGRLLLQMTPEDVDREGLRRTPERVAKAYQHLLGGYRLTPAEAVGQGVFPSEGTGLVCVDDVEFFSLCEHHLLPFWGAASVAYFPGDRILGLSKIPRLIETFARRVQVQERLTQQIVDALRELIAPRAVCVRVRAQHMCMMMRGVEKHQSATFSEAHAGLDQLTAWERDSLFQAGLASNRR